ncbi:MAG: prephenate dehydrogenase/arogenate dehydrogenase family protein [Actinomycetota bacterium]
MTADLAAAPPDGPDVRTLAIIGTGLMGGSLGLAALADGAAGEVVGFDRRSADLAEALARGAVTRVAASAAEAVEGADLVVIATPVGSIPAVFDEIAPHLEIGAVVTDVGSTKTRIVEEIGARVPPGVHFVGGHPMAGSEHEGIGAATADLYTGCLWFLTPTEGTSTAAYTRLLRLLSRLGARVLSLDPARHDQLLALTSHLPQLLSSTLMAFAADMAAQAGGLPIVAAGGFRDMTRIAASSPDLWVDILRENRAAVLEILGRFEEALQAGRERVEREDWEGVRTLLAGGRAARRALPARVRPDYDAVELLIPVPDHPGVLADVTTAVGEQGVNIDDLEIIHGPEGAGGRIRLVVSGSDGERLATEALRRRGYEVEYDR